VRETFHAGKISAELKKSQGCRSKTRSTGIGVPRAWKLKKKSLSGRRGFFPGRKTYAKRRTGVEQTGGKPVILNSVSFKKETCWDPGSEGKAGVGLGGCSNRPT